MPFSFAPLILALLAHGREVVGDIEEALAALGSSQHGLAKIENIAEALGHIATHTAAQLAQLGGSSRAPEPPPAPQPPATMPEARQEQVGDGTNTGA